MDYKAYVCLAVCSLLLMVAAVQSQDTADDEIQNEIRYNISEELQQGTFVGNVIRDADLSTRFGDDKVAQMKIRFLSKPDLDLDIDEDSGVIRTGGRIDRDEICPGKLDCDYKLDIVAIIPGTNFLEIIKASVSVIDMNDNWPNFPRTEMHEKILESADRGTSFRIPTAIDPDSGQLGIQSYVLQPASNVFTLVVNRKMDGAIEVRLKLEGELDRETQDTYEFQIVAYDGGDPPKSGSIDVLITVEDANDNDPVFDNTTYEVSLYENVPIHTTIIQVHATDKDSGLYGQVFYKFSPTTEENYGHLFGIKNTTGEVYVKGIIDYEVSSIYHLSVSAYDRGPDSLPGDTTVIVRVQDINDNAPQITVNTLAATGTDTASIEEDADLDTFVAYITVVDPDAGNNGQFRCSLNDNHFSLKRIGQGEYKVVTKAFLDRETRSDYNLAVMCDDEGRETQVAIKHVHIEVNDVNDNTPVFKQQSYAADIRENNLVGASIAQVNATDKDAGINAEITYSLQDTVLNTFDIDPTTGAITAKTVFDREQVQQFQFEVYGSDKGNPSHTSTTLVFVNIDDVNDEIPKFSQNTYSFGVHENSPIGSEVGIVHAVDLDSEPFNQFEFSFLPNEASMDKFAIDKESGKIVTKAVLDRESDQLYYLTVVAADKGAPMISSTATVSVYVADENDNEPEFEYPSKYNNTVYISSRVPLGFVLTRLQAHDRDIGKNGNLTFSIYDGNEKNYFRIDPLTGAITVNLELKHITYEIFEFTVVVRDQGIPEKMDLGNLNVVVNRSIGYPHGHEESSSLLGPNATIVISLACVSGVIVLCLIVAIVVLRRQDHRDKHNKYNETAKVLSTGDVESPKHQPAQHTSKTSGITWPISLKKKKTTIPPPPPAPARMSNGHAMSMAIEHSAPEKPPRSPLKAHSAAVSNPKYQVCINISSQEHEGILNYWFSQVILFYKCLLGIPVKISNQLLLKLVLLK